MPLTVKDLRPGAAPVQRNIASLVGGVVIAVGCFILAVLVASQLSGGLPSLPVLALAAVFATAVGVWIRLADL